MDNIPINNESVSSTNWDEVAQQKIHARMVDARKLWDIEQKESSKEADNLLKGLCEQGANKDCSITNLDNGDVIAVSYNPDNLKTIKLSAELIREFQSMNFDLDSTLWKKAFFQKIRTYINEWNIKQSNNELYKKLSWGKLDIYDYRVFNINEKIWGDNIYIMQKKYLSWNATFRDKMLISWKIKSLKSSNSLNTYVDMFWERNRLDYRIWSIWNNLFNWSWEDVPDFMEDKIIEIYKDINLDWNFDYSNNQKDYIRKIAMTKWLDTRFIDNWREDFSAMFRIIIRKAQSI